MMCDLSLRLISSAPYPLMQTSLTPPCGKRSIADTPTLSVKQRAMTSDSAIERLIARLILRPPGSFAFVS
jgi:hypothetical protein